MSEVLEAITSLNPVGSEIARAFHLMGIAEEEIAAAKKASRSKAELIDKAFLALRPEGGFGNAPDALYRCHCREILARIVAEVAIQPGTKAEVLWAMFQLSLLAPPTEGFSALMERLFSSCLPAEAKRLGGEGFFKEAYDGQCDELHAKFQRKLLVSNRGKE
jgi:hypothetical protein